MIVEVIDKEKKYIFNTMQSGSKEALYDYFAEVEVNNRTFKKIEIEFAENTFLEDMESIFTEMDRKDKIIRQVVILNEV